MSAALRQRRGRAAAVCAMHERRAQLGWDDLAAWPDWADESGAAPALAARVGAVWHAAALRRCIHGATLQRAQRSLGEEALRSIMGGDSSAASTAPLPDADHIEAWLQAQGAEVMLAAVPSPLLRLVLRDRHWPQTLPQLSSPDAATAAQALQTALSLPTSRAAA
jgi:hypothetical protein